MYSLTLLLLELGLLVLNGVDCSIQIVTLQKGSTIIIPCYTDYPYWFVNDVMLLVSKCDLFTCYNTFPSEFFAKHQRDRLYLHSDDIYWPYLRVMNANKSLTKLWCNNDIWLINVTESVQEQISLTANWMRLYYDVQYKSDVTFVCKKWTGSGSRLSLVRDNPFSVLATGSDSAIITYTMNNVPRYPPYFTVECTIDNDTTKILIEVEENEIPATERTTLNWTLYDQRSTTSISITTKLEIAIPMSLCGLIFMICLALCIRNGCRPKSNDEMFSMFHGSTTQSDNITAGQYCSLAAPQLDNTTARQNHSSAVPQLDSTTAGQYRSLSPPQLDNMPAGQYRNFAAPQLDNTTSGQYGSSAAPQLDNITAGQCRSLAAQQLDNTRSGQYGSSAAPQLDSATAGQCRSLSQPQLDNITAGQCSSLAEPQLDNITVSEPPVYEECVQIFTIARAELNTAADPPPPAYESLPPSYEDYIALYRGVS